MSTLVCYIKIDLGLDNECVTTCSKAACLCMLGEFEFARVRMLCCNQFLLISQEQFPLVIEKFKRTQVVELLPDHSNRRQIKQSEIVC